MRRILAFALLLTAVPALGQETVTPGTPDGWLFGGNYDKYEVGTAVLPRMTTGTQVAYIKAGPEAECGAYGALFQTIAADRYRGKRVKFSARLLEQGLRGGNFNMFVFAGWRGGVSAVSRARWDGFLQPVGVEEESDNFRNVSIIVPVTASVKEITFGFRLTGPGGTGWVDAVRIEVIGDIQPPPVSRTPAAATRPPRESSLWSVRYFHGHQCALRKSWLTARGLYDLDERSLTTLARRPAPQGVQVALASE